MDMDTIEVAKIMIMISKGFDYKDMDAVNILIKK